MRCALVFYFVATIFVVVYSVPELCVIEDWTEGKAALCASHSVNYTFDFIPPVSQKISYINLKGQPLKRLPYNAFRNISSQRSISRIWLEVCQISHVDAGALLNLHNLTIIGLSHNDITHIDSKLFSDTKQIKLIYMGHNKIEVLPSGLFQNLPVLEKVYLNYNRIRQVEWFSFRNTPALRIIYLNGNQIEFMDMFFKDTFDNLTILWLADNPWKCNCKLGPLYELLVKINHLNQYKLVCEKPPTLHGRQWSDISRDKFACPSEDAISAQDSVMTSTKTKTITEQDNNVPVTTHYGTRYQPVTIGIPEPQSILSWILYTILVLVLVCIAAVIIVIIFVVRHALLKKSNKRRHVRLPTIIKRRSFRRSNARQMDSDIPMRVIQSSAVSEDGGSASNTDDVDEEQTSSHHYAICEATTS